MEAAKKLKYYPKEYSTEALLRMEQSLGEIEIPGQCIVENKAVYREIDQDKHILIASVGRNIELQFLNRKLVRSISFNGSNCKKYNYNIEITSTQNNNDSFEK